MAKEPAKSPAPSPAKPTVAAATGSAGLGGKGQQSKLSEEAVRKAIEAAHAEGVTDPKEINKRMLEAMRKVRGGGTLG